jgi:hypothetical protein
LERPLKRSDGENVIFSPSSHLLIRRLFVANRYHASTKEPSSRITMSSAPVLISNFDVNKLAFGKQTVKLSSGGKIANVEFNGARRLTIQTPAVFLPFGLSKPFQGDENAKWSVDLSFRGYETTPAIAAFLQKMRELDDVILKAATENSQEWLGKKMPKDIVAEFYKPLIKEPKNPQYAPTMGAKIQQGNAHFFDIDRSPAEMAVLTKGCKAKFILEANCIWFMNKSFGLGWKVRQALVTEKPSGGEESVDDGALAFVDDDEMTDVSAEKFI